MSIGSVGQVIAVVVLLLSIVFGVMHALPWVVAGLIAALAVARLL